MRSLRLSTLAAWLLIILIPMRILSAGFLPVDDALRHVGKALTDRPWTEILVLRPEATEDSHPGWHWALRTVHQATGANNVDLVFFSVIALYALVAGVGLGQTSPIAWMLTLLVAYATAPSEMQRWVMGRPYLVSASVVLLLTGRWSRSGPHQPRDWPFLALLFGVVAWIHPSYYLFGVPVLALILCREYVGAAVLGSAVAAGAVIAGCLTGHPVKFLYQSVMHPVWSLSWPTTTLAGEFQPGLGAPIFVLAFFAATLFLNSGSRRGTWNPPVATFALLGWILSFVSSRFWMDWGLPAAMMLLARMFEEWLESTEQGMKLRRHGVLVALMVFLIATPDTNGRWSGRAQSPYLVLTGQASRHLLPSPGGVLYSDDMRVFYEVFFRLPNAPFRYALGYEPGLMPLVDQNLLRQEIASGLYLPFEDWVKKMTPRDRMVLRSDGAPPPLSGLEWTRVSRELWVGMKAAASPEGEGREPQARPPKGVATPSGSPKAELGS